MRADDGDEHDRDQHDVPHEHLPEVHHVEERADSHRVECVLAAGGDPLGVEVLLGHIAGEALDDRGNERDNAGDPGHRPAAAPGGHPELAPQVNDQQRHEQLDAPQVHAVEEMPERVVMPPVGAAKNETEPGNDRHPQRRQRAHAEHVHPGRHVSGLPVRQQLARRQHGHRAPPHPRSPHARRAISSSGGSRSRSGRPAVRNATGNRGRLLSVPPGERQQQRRAEDHHHHRDQDQIRHRYRENRPVHEEAG